MTVEMSKARLDEFLRSPRYAAVASLRRSGAPFVIPLGYLYDGERFLVSISNGRSFISRARNDSRVSLTVFNDSYPVACVIIEATAREIDDPGDKVSKRIARRYCGDVEGLEYDEFESRWLRPGRTVFEIEPHHVVSFDLSQNYREWPGT